MEMKCDNCESSNVEKMEDTSDYIGESIKFHCKDCSRESQIYVELHKCRVCGCSWFDACAGSCYWVDEWLCSSCVDY